MKMSSLSKQAMLYDNLCVYKEERRRVDRDMDTVRHRLTREIRDENNVYSVPIPKHPVSFKTVCIYVISALFTDTHTLIL